MYCAGIVTNWLDERDAMSERLSEAIERFLDYAAGGNEFSEIDRRSLHDLCDAFIDTHAARTSHEFRKAIGGVSAKQEQNV